MKLELVGRAPDNWIHMMGSATDMDPAPLFMLGGKNKESPLLGHLFLAGDLWANTDTNFFETLAGDMTITVRDGTLNKFTLLSRLLSFIDIKNWLSAQIPDPRVNGVPFKTIFTDFKGSGGLFYTDNFALQGSGDGYHGERQHPVRRRHARYGGRDVSRSTPSIGC